MTPMLRLLPIAAFAVLALPAAAQDGPPVYKCAGRSGVTYTHVPCAGAQPLGTGRVSRSFDRHTPPPQDRARQMARAQLPPETRAQCAELETRIRAEEARLRAKPVPPTEAEEGDLAIDRVHYREMRC